MDLNICLGYNKVIYPKIVQKTKTNKSQRYFYKFSVTIPQYKICNTC